MNVVRRRSLIPAGLERADYAALRSGAIFQPSSCAYPDITLRTGREG